MSHKTVPPKTNAELQAAMREREKARGIIRKLVRIPAEKAEELDEIVRRWMKPTVGKGDEK